MVELESKSDHELGSRVRQYLIEKGVETPTIAGNFNPDPFKVQAAYRQIMQEFGLDLSDSSLKDTPSRVAKMFCNELFRGLDYNQFPKATMFDVKHDEMIIVKDIKVMSVCEHHIQTISGKCHIGYIPSRCVGLSKLNRFVDFFCRRPQVQERLTEQIFYALEYVLGTEDIAVLVHADHFCVKARGVGDQNSSTITTKVGGSFRNIEARTEFLSLVRN